MDENTSYEQESVSEPKETDCSVRDDRNTDSADAAVAPSSMESLNMEPKTASDVRDCSATIGTDVVQREVEKASENLQNCSAIVSDDQLDAEKASANLKRQHCDTSTDSEAATSETDLLTKRQKIVEVESVNDVAVERVHSDFIQKDADRADVTNSDSANQQTTWTDIDSELFLQDLSGVRTPLHENVKNVDICDIAKSSGVCENSKRTDICESVHNDWENVQRTHILEIVSRSDVEPNIADDHMHVEPSVNVEIFTADYAAKPQPVTEARSSFASSKQNFLRGAKWSPDGSCILTNSSDNQPRVFNLPTEFFRGKIDSLPEMNHAVKVRGGDLVYDFCWYPGMSIADPLTCCFVTTTRDHPIHLWDSLTGQLRCSYRPFNHLDELTSAYSVAFSDDGQLLYCGFEKMIRVFDISRPGRDCQSRPTFMKLGQPGIISCICTNPAMSTVYAAGSYSRSVALYSEPKGDMMCMFQGQIGGVTHIKFSSDGTKLFSGGRKDPEILCWDIRNPGNILFTMQRKVTTNQRVYFDFDSTGRYVMSGNQDGTVSIWDGLQAPETHGVGEPILRPIASVTVHEDTVNSLSCHPNLPAIVTGSGQRHFKVTGISDSEDSDAEGKICDNSIKVWWFSNAAAPVK